MRASQPQPAPPPDASVVFSSARWLSLGQVLAQVARFVVTVVLARHLAPAAFGLLAMAGVFSVFAGLFSTLGTGPVIVQRRDLSEVLLRTLTSVGLAMGLLLTGALAASSWSIARFYNTPQIAWIVVALGSSFALTAVGLVPEGLLQRELRFSRLVAIDIVQLFISSTVSITLAVAGWDVWALVVGNLAGVVVRSTGLVLSSPWRLRLGFSLEAARGVFGFSAGVMGFNLVHYLARYTDRLLIGRLLGATPLGFYDYAYQFYMYPLDVVSAVLLRLMFPTFARLQGDREQLGRAFLRTSGAIALVAFPMMAGLAAVADPFVRGVLGEKWAPIIPLIQILAPVGMLQSLGATPGQLFLALGRAGLRFWWSIIYTSVIIAAVVVGVRWGIRGVATAYAAVMVPIILVAFWLALRLVNLRLAALWTTLRATLAATGIMTGLVIALRVALEPTGAPRVLELAAAVTTGAITYVLVTRWLAPEALGDLYRFLPEWARTQPAIAWFFATARTAHG